MESTDLQRTDLRQLVSALLEDRGRQVFSVTPQTSVHDAVRQMNQSRIGSLVVQEGGLVVGIFTERDALTRVLGERRDPTKTSVGDVMTSDVACIRPSTTVEEAMVLMTEKKFRHLPVLDDGGLYGLISIGDLAHWLVRHQQYRLDELVQYISGGYRSTIPPAIASEFPKRVARRDES